MANYTSNFNLMKPLGSENYNVSQQNGNMDKIDSALQGLGNGLGIIANGNTHVAITSGEYVYVHGHDTLAEGLYKATANIAANGTLSSSNLAALSKGVGGDVSALNSNLGGLKEFDAAVESGTSTLKIPKLTYGMMIVRNGDNSSFYSLDVTRCTHIAGTFSAITTDGNENGQTLSMQSGGSKKFFLLYV